MLKHIHLFIFAAIITLLIGTRAIFVFAADGETESKYFNEKQTMQAAVGGDYGENITWSISDGVLYINGVGDLDNTNQFNYKSWLNPATGEMGTEHKLAPWYDYREQIVKCVIGEGITSIGQYDFYSFSNLKEVQLPTTLKAINNAAFYGCSALEKINIPDSLTHIGEYAFTSCRSLKSLAITGPLQELNWFAFYDCTGLETVILPDSLTVIEQSVFRRCRNLKEIKWSDHITEIKDYAFCECTSLTGINLPTDIKIIGIHAFYGAGEIIYQGTACQFHHTIETQCYSGNFYCTEGENHKFGQPVISELQLDTTSADHTASYICEDCGAIFTVEYSIIENEIVIKNFYADNAYRNIVLPEKIDGHDVVRIEGIYGFFTKLIIPEGIQEVYMNFYLYQDEIKELYMPKSLSSSTLNNVPENTKVYCFYDSYPYRLSDINGYNAVCLDWEEERKAATKEEVSELPAIAGCEHTWQKVKEILHHDVETEQKWILDSHSANKPGPVIEHIYMGVVHCNIDNIDGTHCGAEFANEHVDKALLKKWGNHLQTAHIGSGGYTTDTSFDSYRYAGEDTVYYGETGHYEAGDIISEAYDEILFDGYECQSCRLRIPIHEHDAVIIPGYAAGCLTDGLSDGTMCSVCGIILQEQEIIPAKGHTPNEMVEEHRVEPTTSEEGKVQEAVYCKVCGGEISRKTVILPKLERYEEPKTEPVQPADPIEPIIPGKAESPFKTTEPKTIPTNQMLDSIFPDVSDKTKAYYKPVYWAVRNNITVGYKNGYFGPEDSCTRSQFVTFIWRMAGKPVASTDVSFTDVGKSMSAYRAIAWAVEEGIIVGYKDGTFRPNEPVLRRQVAVMLWRWVGKPAAMTSVNPFEDMTPSESSYRAVLWGSAAGVIKGSKTAKGTQVFKPADICQRQQIVTFLYRYARDVMGQDVN